MKLMFFISNTGEPMHWAIAGLIIGLVVPALLLIGNKNFGVSSTLRHLCTIVLPSKRKGFFSYDLKPHYWSLIFIIGIALGGLIAHFYNPDPTLSVGEKTSTFLLQNNVKNTAGLYPGDLFSLQNTKGLILLIVGGFLVGFGTRYANGCTSGHSIFGIANLQISSIIATIAFFAGGLTMTYFILPIIL
ncbi:MAG: putative membrane protein YedE/YeeE [Saprospiraceae bacterium]|jgi:uncharacterized membrane protein YedE/YeeE|tara:strand:+ start:224 stop:787 length:564 start_codon:yes stop_codon:yes gene_type:complete